MANYSPLSGLGAVLVLFIVPSTLGSNENKIGNLIMKTECILGRAGAREKALH